MNPISSKFQTTPIFIGGTGRSGTSVLGDYIGAHPRVLRLPYEIRIFTDRAGLVDLKSALTRNFSQQAARATVNDFISFSDALICAYTAPYLGYNIDKRMKTNLRKARSKFLNEILIGHFEGWDKELHDRVPIFQVPARLSLRLVQEALSRLPILEASFKHKTWKSFVSYESLPVPKYFPAVQPLDAAIRAFIREVFGPMLEITGSDVWCDATPSNLAYVDELLQIYPSAKFVHVVRHPVGVAQSMMERRWMPRDVETVATSLYQSYARISDQIKSPNCQGSVMTVKIEELSNLETQAELNDFLGDDFSEHNQSVIKKSISEGWRKRVSRRDAEVFESILSPFIQEFNYVV
jgi:hypothetical protein